MSEDAIVEQIALHVHLACKGCGRKLETSEVLAGDSVRTGNHTQRASWLEEMRNRIKGAAQARKWEWRIDGYRCAHCVAVEADPLGSLKIGGAP
jgi:hypothetical protein